MENKRDQLEPWSAQEVTCGVGRAIVETMAAIRDLSKKWPNISEKKDGLPDASVYALAQDADGYILFFGRPRS